MAELPRRLQSFGLSVMNLQVRTNGDLAAESADLDAARLLQASLLTFI